MNNLRNIVISINWADPDDIAAGICRMVVRVLISGEIVGSDGDDVAVAPEPWEIDEHDVFGSVGAFQLADSLMAILDVDTVLRREVDARREAWNNYGRAVSQPDPVLAGAHH